MSNYAEDFKVDYGRYFGSNHWPRIDDSFAGGKLVFVSIPDMPIGHAASALNKLLRYARAIDLDMQLMRLCTLYRTLAARVLGFYTIEDYDKFMGVGGNGDDADEPMDLANLAGTIAKYAIHHIDNTDRLVSFSVALADVLLRNYTVRRKT